jgi:hypothetical protein
MVYDGSPSLNRDLLSCQSLAPVLVVPNAIVLTGLINDQVGSQTPLPLLVAPSFALFIGLERYFELSLFPRLNSTVVDQVALLNLRFFLVDSGLTDSYRGLQYQCRRLLLLSSIRCTRTRVTV